MSLALLALLLAGCSKAADGDAEEAFDPHPTWTDSDTNGFWDKHALNHNHLL